MNADMVQGYFDGRNPDNPEPSANRSRSYRHGFQSGRDDLDSRRQPYSPARFDERVKEADETDELDRAQGLLESPETHG